MPIPSWSTYEDDYLAQHWDYVSPERLARDISERFGRYSRTAKAVVTRAKRIGLPRRTKTLCELARATGYDRSRITIAMEKLSIRPRRSGAWHAITPAEEERIVAFLASIPDGRRLRRAIPGAWGGVDRNGQRKPRCCIDCGRNDRPYYCKGRCRKCDRRWRKRQSMAS